MLLSDAYAVYDGLEEEDKKDASKIEDVLLQAFSLDAFAAYELFTKLKMTSGRFFGGSETLACLARLPDEAVRLAFVVGLPEAVSSRFRAAKETIDVVLPKVRSTLNRKSTNESNMTTATTRRNVVRTKSSESIVCYNCRGLNQIAKNCATPQEECSVFQMRRDGTRGVKMYKAARKRGGERSVCASSLSNTRGLSALVVIQIKVNGKHARAIVDTGCSTTFVFQNLVSSDQLERASDVKVTTFGGEVQKCDGTATVSLEVGNVCTRDHV